MSWVTKFFQNQGWLGIARYGKDSSGNITGFIDANGNAVVPTNKTLTEFLALLPADVADGAVVRITNVHGPSGAGGVYATWDATASKWGQNFGTPWVFADLATLVASFPAASFTGWIFRLTGVNGDLISNGTKYVPKHGGIILSQNVYGTLALPTKNSGTGTTTYSFDIGSPSIQLNLLGSKAKLKFKAKLQRHLANATMTVLFRLGTANGSTDSSFWSATIPATDLAQVNADVLIDFADSTHFLSNMNNQQAGSGATGAISERSANVNTASTMYISCDISSKNSSDTLDLLSYMVEWVEV